MEEPLKENQTAAKNQLNEQSLRILFTKCPDIQFTSFKFKHNHVSFIYCSGLINMDMLFNLIPSLIGEFFNNYDEVLTVDSILEGLNLPSLAAIDNEEQAISEIFAGKLLIDFGLTGTIFIVDISERPQRSPEDTKTETSILGPRDDFIEDIHVNISLIRKRLRTSSFVFEEFTIGKRTNTKLALLYMDDIARKEILEQLKNKLSTIKVDGLASGTQLEEFINDSPYALLPRHKYTGKPDFAVQSLLSGRFVILIDGVTIAYITPITFFNLLKSSEDREITYIYASFQRILRILGLFISFLLPGIWIALTTYHQDQIPLILLATVVETRRGVPFPSALEAIGMLLMFDLFREAGIRLPMAIGQILSVVGGLIIGDAAINSGLTSPSMLVIIALSTIATFTLSDQSLIGTLSIIRLFSILMASTLGFFGVLMSFFFVCCYVSSIEIFGEPYIDGTNKFNLGTVLKSMLRIPAPKMISRPEELNLNDDTRKGD